MGITRPYLSKHHGHQKEEEDSLVAFTDAIANRRAVVVKPKDTLVTHLKGSFGSGIQILKHFSLLQHSHEAGSHLPPYSHLAVL